MMCPPNTLPLPPSLPSREEARAAARAERSALMFKAMLALLLLWAAATAGLLSRSEELDGCGVDGLGPNRGYEAPTTRTAARDGAGHSTTPGRIPHLEGAGSDPVVVGILAGRLERVAFFAERRPGGTLKVHPQAGDSRTGCASSPVQWILNLPFRLTNREVGLDCLTTWTRDKNFVTGGAAAPRYTCYPYRGYVRVNACDGGHYQMAFPNLYNGARARDPSVLNSFPVQEAGYCAGGDLVVPIHMGQRRMPTQVSDLCIGVRPRIKQTTGTQAGPVTEASRGWRASSRGGVKAGLRPTFRLRVARLMARARPLRVRTRALVVGIGAPTGSRKWPEGLRARAFAWWGSLDLKDLYWGPAGPRREVDGSQRDPGWWSSIQDGGAGSMAGRWVFDWAGGGGPVHVRGQA